MKNELTEEEWAQLLEPSEVIFDEVDSEQITDEQLYQLAQNNPMRYMRFVTKDMLIKYT